MKKVVVLLTDFGLEDWFVGTMKGVIKGIAPAVEIIDLCHQVAPGDIQGGALTLFFSYSYFPQGTIFCCVVDPGVGTDREAIVATDGNYRYVAPNNGLLGPVAARAGSSWRCHKIENPELMLPHPSQTFHGRDIFAPAAAHLAKGVALTKFGKPLRNFISLQLPAPHWDGRRLTGKIIYIDRFGNLITNLSAEEIFTRFKKATHNIALKISGIQIKGLKRTYKEVRRGEPLMYIGSSGYLEIGINQGNAARQLTAQIGTSFYLTFPDQRRGK